MRAIVNRLMHLFVMAAAAVCCGPVHAAWQFTTVDFPDAIEANLFGLNDKGQAVGFAFEVLSPEVIHPFAFVYDIKKGGFTRLPRAFGEEFGTFGSGLNNEGVIVGNFFNELGSPAFIRDRKGEYTAYMRPGSQFLTNFRGVNDRRLIAGFADDGDLLVGFLFDPASNTYVDFLPSPSTIAHGINNRGDVVGSTLVGAGVACAQCPEGFYGFVRSASGAITLFRVNGLDTRARGLSDSGVVAGQVDRPSGEVRSFVTRVGNASYEAITIPDGNLLQYPGMPVTVAEGIDDSGNVVGFYRDASFAEHGFVARRSPH